MKSAPATAAGAAAAVTPGEPRSARQLLRGLGNPFVLALLCLPTLLAVGLMTSAPLGAGALQVSLVAAFVACTVGGLLVAVIARAPAEITVPTPSTTVIFAALGMDLVNHAAPGQGLWEIWAAMSIAVMMMGVLLLSAGLLRLADFIKFMPAPVTAGFVTGIGLLVIWSQLGPMVGAAGRVARLQDLAASMKTGSVLVAAVTVLTLVVATRMSKKGQPVLVAVCVGTAVYYVVRTLFEGAPLGGRLQPMEVGSTALGTVASIWRVFTRESPLGMALQVLPYAGLLALQAVMNAATTSVSVGNVLGKRSDVNRTLVAQGLANMIGGCVGSLPVSTSGTLSVPAAAMTADRRALASATAVLLFILVVVAGDRLGLLPVAVLATVLMMSGVAMVKQSTFKLLKAAWSAQHRDAMTLATPALALIVAATFFFGSVPMALLVGAMLAMLLLTLQLSATTRFSLAPGARVASRRVWPPAQADWLLANASAVAVFRPEGALFFGTADRLAQQLQAPPAGTRFCVLDLSRVTTVDATACEIIATGARALAAAGVTPLVAGVSAAQPRGRSLVALGLVFPDPKSRWFQDTDHAVEHAETEMLREADPAFDAPAAFSFADTPLTLGIDETRLQVLRAVLRPLDFEPGPLFQHGDPGGSMFIVERGRVEIRVSGGDGQQPVRLAAFAEGSIFGELSLLMDQARTADAICTASSRLLELDRAAMDRLEAHSPELFAAIMRNLSLHVARRLDAATGLVRSLQ